MVRIDRTGSGFRLLLAAALVVGVAGSALLGAAPARAQDEPLVIAFSIPGLNFPFFVHMEREVRAEAERLGNIEIVTLDAQNQAAKQVADLEGAIIQDVDGILVSPHSEAVAPAVQEAIEAGIPVVTIDRAVTGVDTLAHVGADNVRGGEVQGEYLLEVLPDGGGIFELTGTPGASAAIDRDRGLKNVLEGQDAITIVFEQTGQFTREGGLAVTESGLAANPEPAAVVCGNDDMCFGAIEALEAAGIEGVPIIGFDALPPALLAVQDGSMTATVEQWPGRQVAGGLGILVDYLRNETEPAQHDNFIEPTLITLENLGEAERVEEAGIAPSGSPDAGDATPAASVGLVVLGLLDLQAVRIES